MNQYRKLMSNTFIFAIGTFSSKLLVFFMTRFYTAMLTTGEYGMIESITTIANVLIPIASLCIPQAVIRYGLEKSESKHEVFSIGFTTIFLGFLLALPFAPLVNLISDMGGYLLLIYVYVLTSSLQSLCSYFVRARGYSRLYALSGVFRTIVMIGLNILFLVQFQLGVTGYILAIILSDLLCALALFAIADLHRFLHVRALTRRTWKRMLTYAVPLIPTQICVWIFSASDRLFLTQMIGQEATGLYSFAYKMPTILILVSGIFIEAWQISTINDNSEQEQIDFFSKVGNVYQCLVFFLASGVILMAKPATWVLAGSESYLEGWKLIPLLIFGSAFACLSNFQNSIYTLKKRTGYSMLTAGAGAGLNLVLNYLLIPPLGANGAALATLLCYILMFLLRAMHSRKLLEVRWNIPRFVLMFLLLCLQSGLMLRDSPYWLLEQALLCLAMGLLGFREILQAIQKVLRRR